MHKRGPCFVCVAAFVWLSPLVSRAQDTVAVPSPDSAAAVVDSTTVVNPPSVDSTASVDSAWYNTAPFVPVRIQPRHVPANDVPELRKDDDFWYVAVGPDKPKPPSQPPKNLSAWQKFFRALADFFDTPWAAFLLWSLLAGLLVAAIVAFIQSGSGESLFRRSRRLRLKEMEGPDADRPEDPELALQKALEAGNHAEAERCLFLLALGRLGDRGMIQLATDKTNREYLREMRGNPLFDDFVPLLRHYEYTFYGGFTMSLPAFQAIREQYTRFQKRLDAL